MPPLPTTTTTSHPPSPIFALQGTFGVSRVTLLAPEVNDSKRRHRFLTTRLGLVPSPRGGRRSQAAAPRLHGSLRFSSRLSLFTSPHGPSLPCYIRYFISIPSAAPLFLKRSLCFRFLLQPPRVTF